MTQLPTEPRKDHRLRSLIFTMIKIIIAVGGLWYVISHTPWHDVATLKQGTQIAALELLEPVEVTVLESPAAPPTPNALFVRFPDQPVKLKDADGRQFSAPLTLNQGGQPVREADIAKAWLVSIDNRGEPKITIGLRNLMRRSNPWLLLLAWVLIGIPLFLNAWRWKKLMEPQGVHLPLGKCIALSFVGQFYSTFLPGTTSGDLVKIVYTSRVIGSKTKSAITVILDRVTGLLALFLIAGIAAAFQMQGNPTMRNVVLLVAAVFAVLTLGAVVYFSRRIRDAVGLTRLISNPKTPEVIRKADDVLHSYRRAWSTLLLAFFAAMVTQILIPISAWVAGRAFGIENAHLGHYLAYIPLAILAAALPVSFLGLGVMDGVIFMFFCQSGLADASRTFALTQAIRFLPVVWNMLGAYWVVTGKYSRHQAEVEEKQLDSEAGAAPKTAP
jgi:glycosyltransferase 2 family protein